LVSQEASKPAWLCGFSALDRFVGYGLRPRPLSGLRSQLTGTPKRPGKDPRKIFPVYCSLYWSKPR